MSNSETDFGPNNELKKVGHVFLSDTIVSKDTMVIHVIDTSIASATVTDPDVSSCVATLWAVLVLFLFLLVLLRNDFPLVIKTL